MILSPVFRLLRHAGERHLGLIAAGVAFFGMLAVFPALAALVAIWGFFADPDVVAQQLEQVAEFLPPDAYALLFEQVDALVGAGPGQIGWATAVSLGAALWSARAGVAALIDGLNATFDVESRGGLWHQVIALGLTLALVGAALTALAAGIAVPLVLAFAPLGPFEAVLITVSRWSIAPAITLLGLALVYRYGPNLPAGRRPPLLSRGLLVAALLWVVASEGFAIYLSNFDSYNRIYGSIGAVVALLMWLYVSAYAVLLGGAVNALRSAPQ